MKILSDMTLPYSAPEAWVYDKVIAPAVGSFVDAIPLDLGVGARILDVGCGGGQVLLAMAARRPDLRLAGVDLSSDQVRRAGRRTGLLVRQGDALALPFGDHEFDGLYSVASIKHWPDATRGLAECGRVVRAGGPILVIEADRACRMDDTRAFVARWRLPRILKPAALAAFRTWVAGQSLDSAELHAHAVEAGLRDVTVRRVPGLPAIALEALAP